MQLKVISAVLVINWLSGDFAFIVLVFVSSIPSQDIGCISVMTYFMLSGT